MEKLIVITDESVKLLTNAKKFDHKWMENIEGKWEIINDIHFEVSHLTENKIVQLSLILEEGLNLDVIDNASDWSDSINWEDDSLPSREDLENEMKKTFDELGLKSREENDMCQTVALDIVEVQPVGEDLEQPYFPPIDWIEYKDLPSNFTNTTNGDWEQYYKQGGDDMSDYSYEDNSPIDYADYINEHSQNEDKMTFTVDLGEVTTDEAHATLSDMMESYKQDVTFNEETGEIDLSNYDEPFSKEYWLPTTDEEYTRIGYLDNSPKEEITWDEEKGSITVNGKALSITDKVYWCPTKYDIYNTIGSPSETTFKIDPAGESYTIFNEFVGKIDPVNGNIGIGMSSSDIITYGDAGQVQINGEDMVAYHKDIIYKDEFINSPKGIEVIDDMIYMASLMASNIIIDCEDPRKEEEILNYLSKLDLNTKHLAKQVLTYGTISYEKVYNEKMTSVTELKSIPDGDHLVKKGDFWQHKTRENARALLPTQIAQLHCYPGEELFGYSDMMHVAYFELGLHKFDYELNCSITNASYVDHDYNPNLAQQAFIKYSFLESDYFNISDGAKDAISNAKDTDRFIDMLQANIIEFYYDIIRSDERFKYYNFSITA